MKKLFPYLIMIVGLTACVANPTISTNTEVQEVLGIKIKMEDKNDLIIDRSFYIVPFEYDNHKYLLFSANISNYESEHIIHNPDCPCLKINGDKQNNSLFEYVH